MKTTNSFFAIGALMLLMLCAPLLHAQEEAENELKYLVITKKHWDLNKKDFKLSEWKALEKEYLEKVTKRNEYILLASVYLHNMTADNTELLVVEGYSSWENIDKSTKRSAELAKEVWPDGEIRKAHFKNMDSYYSHEHSDEIYAPLNSTFKYLAEAPTKDMVVYVKRSHFAYPENGSYKEFDALNMEGLKGITFKNEYVKGYFSYVHAWGADNTEYLEAYFLDSLADIDKMFDRDDALFKETFPDNEENKEKIETWLTYFTGVHGDYIYTYIHDLSK